MKKNTPNITGHDGENRTDITTALIDAVVDGQNISIKVSFNNTSSTDPVYLAKYRGASNNKMVTNFFAISTNNSKVPYVGMMAKIKPTASDFIELPPLGTATFSVKIDESYAFLEGTHSYEVKYRAYHEYPELSLGDPITSNVIKFKYSK